MSIEQTIIDAVSIGSRANIPVLFFSNPGLGKTTILKRYAQNQGMFLQTLIGSRYTPEEISGYQVNNGGESLTHMNPSWYNEILENENQGTPTLLFIDELSTCNESVQGVLLTLIFDRTIGYGKFLPESCVIVAAANYAPNLTSFMNILSPTLNRFMIVNLNQDYTSLDMANEFLLPPKEPYYPECTPLPLADKEMFVQRFHDFWSDTFVKYSDPQSSFGIIDVSNPELGNLYQDSGNLVLNFISGRTLSYLQKAVLAYMELKLMNKTVLNKIIDGLVGAGSCSFTSKKQLDAYQKHLHTNIAKIAENKRTKKVSMDKLTGNISKDVANFLMNRESLNMNPSEELYALSMLIMEINDQFKVENVMELTQTKDGICKFQSNMESVIELRNSISQYPDIKNVATELSNLTMAWYPIYCDITKILVDYKKVFGCCNTLFSRLCLVRYDSQSLSKIQDHYFHCGIRTNPYSKPNLYKLNPGESFMELKLGNMLPSSSSLRILTWNGKKLVLCKLNEYETVTKAV